MKLTIVSGIVGTLILCMIAVLFMFQTEDVKAIIATISVTIILVEGVILIIYSIFGDN